MFSYFAEHRLVFNLPEVLSIQIMKNYDNVLPKFRQNIQKFDNFSFCTFIVWLPSIQHSFSILHDVDVTKLLQGLEDLNQDIVHEYSSVKALDGHYNSVLVIGLDKILDSLILTSDPIEANTDTIFEHCEAFFVKQKYFSLPNVTLNLLLLSFRVGSKFFLLFNWDIFDDIFDGIFVENFLEITIFISFLGFSVLALEIVLFKEVRNGVRIGIRGPDSSKKWDLLR